MLKADLEVDSRAAVRVAALCEPGPALRCGVDVFCGLQDPSFPAADAGEWSAVSSGTEVGWKEHGRGPLLKACFICFSYKHHFEFFHNNNNNSK